MTAPHDAAAIVDGALVRRRREQLGLSARALGTRLGLSSSAVARLEQGANLDTVTLTTLRRLADALAVNITTLLVDDQPALEPNHSGHAAQVGAALHTLEVLTPRGALAQALQLSNAQLKAALETLDANLRHAGLRVHHNGNRVAIRPAVEAIDRDTLEQVTRMHVLRDGFTLNEARMLRHVMNGTVPKNPGNNDQVALGTLINAGLIELGESPGDGREQPWVLTEEVSFGLLIQNDHDQPGSDPSNHPA